MHDHTRNPPPKPIRLPVSGLTLDPEVQQRSATDWDVVAEYAATIEGWIETAPIVVYSDTTTRWVADGFHRVEAARRAEIYAIPAIRYDGDRRDALLYAVGANQTHGLRRSNADKRRAVATLLRDQEWSRWSDRRIAERAGVSAPTVAAARRESRMGADGATHETAKVGESPALHDTGKLEKFYSLPDTCAVGGRVPKPRVGADGKERPAHARPGPARRQSPPSQQSPPSPPPQGPTARDAMHAAHAVAAAISALYRAEAALLPSDAAVLVRELRKAIERIAPRAEGKGGST